MAAETDGAKPDLKWHELYVPPASVVGEFLETLPSLVAGMPGTLGEIGDALSEALPSFSQRERQADREAGG